jgi:hypothetical protein
MGLLTTIVQRWLFQVRPQFQWSLYTQLRSPLVIHEPLATVNAFDCAASPSKPCWLALEVATECNLTQCSSHVQYM